MNDKFAVELYWKKRMHQKELDEAVNLLCEEVLKQLPEGWILRLTMSSEGAELTLMDSEGEEVEYQGGEQGYSSVTSACETAQQIDAVRAGCSEHDF